MTSSNGSASHPQSLASMPRSAFSPPPAPLDEQPDPVRLRVERMADADVVHRLRATHGRILLAATGGLALPAGGLLVVFAPGATTISAGWLIAWCCAAVLGAVAATSAMALPRRPDLIGIDGVADDGRFRPARGASSGMIAAALMLGGLSLALPIDLLATADTLAVRALPWFAALALLFTAQTFLAAFALQAGRWLATMASDASVSLSIPLPAPPDGAAAEQRRRAVARAAESTLAGMERERLLHGTSCIWLSVAGGLALVALVLQVVGVAGAAAVSLGSLLQLVSSVLMLAAVVSAGLVWRDAAVSGVRAALIAGGLSVALALSVPGQLLAGQSGWVAWLAVVVASAALVVAIVVARWHHHMRRHADTAPSVPVLIDALHTPDEAVRQPAHRLLMAVTQTDLPDEPGAWRTWQQQQVAG
ncbi:MAG: hypothetical protein AB7S36_03715 [Planctomycetota bacterium]